MIKQVKSAASAAKGEFVESLARASSTLLWAGLSCACLLGLRADQADDLLWPVMTAQHPATESAMGLEAPTRQWHLERLAAPKAWAASTGEGVVIAVIDSGVDPEHPDLKDHLLPGWNLVDNSADTRDTRGHGTAVAGAAAAGFNRAQGLSGVAAGARILPLKVTDEKGYTSANTVVKAIYLAANRGARIVNVSFEFVGGHPAVLQAARYLHERGGILVVPSGNKGVHQPYPVAPGLVTVAATDEQDAHPAWSTRGPHVTVSAPGQGLLLPKIGGRYAEVHGTSYASPLVAGVLALMVAAHPQAGSDELREALESSALDLGDPGRDPLFGAGRIDADGALRAIAAVASLKAARH